MRAIKIGAVIVAALFMGGCSVLPYEIEVRKSDNQRVRLNPPRGADRLLSPAPHNFRQGFADQGDPVRRGNRSERFELRDGDCGGSDCGNPRARAEIEIKEGLGYKAIGKGIWYGWSFYNQTVPAFRSDNSLRLVFGQWTKGGAGQPVIRFIQLGKDEGSFATCDTTVCDTQNTTTGDLVVQLKDIATARKWNSSHNDGYVCRILDLEATKGRWVDITMNTNFSTGDDGYLRIWVDGRLACNYSGPILSLATANSRRKIKHRRGIYSSWTKRWDDTEGDRVKPNLVVYYDEFQTGDRKQDVDVRLREAVSEQPVD